MNKKLLFIGLGLIAMFAVSCSNDDGASYTEADLIKKWYPVSDEINGVVYPYDDHEECGKDYMQFLAGGAGKNIDVYLCEEYSEPFEWSMSGDKVTVTSEGEPTTATILNLTDNVLRCNT